MLIKRHVESRWSKSAHLYALHGAPVEPTGLSETSELYIAAWALEPATHTERQNDINCRSAFFDALVIWFASSLLDLMPCLFSLGRPLNLCYLFSSRSLRRGSILGSMITWFSRYFWLSTIWVSSGLSLWIRIVRFMAQWFFRAACIQAPRASFPFLSN